MRNNWSTMKGLILKSLKWKTYRGFVVANSRGKLVETQPVRWKLLGSVDESCGAFRLRPMPSKH